MFSCHFSAKIKATKKLQDDGIKIGVSTGFTRAMVDIIHESAKKQRFYPDATVAGNKVENGAVQNHLGYVAKDI